MKSTALQSRSRSRKRSHCCFDGRAPSTSIALSTDYDCWKTDEEHVTVEMVIANLHRNADQAKQVVAGVIPQIPTEPNWKCHRALKNAIMTDRKLWPKKTITELRPLLAKYL